MPIYAMETFCRAVLTFDVKVPRCVNGMFGHVHVRTYSSVPPVHTKITLIATRVVTHVPPSYSLLA